MQQKNFKTKRFIDVRKIVNIDKKYCKVSKRIHQNGVCPTINTMLKSKSKSKNRSSNFPKYIRKQATADKYLWNPT